MKQDLNISAVNLRESVLRVEEKVTLLQVPRFAADFS
jgi:hypothetical protein